LTVWAFCNFPTNQVHGEGRRGKKKARYTIDGRNLEPGKEDLAIPFPYVTGMS
jgi:hypothetical protein